ncbi:DEAD/DEAH box helicase [Deinococcus aquaedulcis]|uniref:DEAD/DEAH box helicase n=1 Tax=Deinococcus aquaedulcis TaxID=2840455 RepID=UPI001C83E157|nr:DEAD/DEAH box helicase family protein [Deinococcus aquaedulcis]
MAYYFRTHAGYLSLFGHLEGRSLRNNQIGAITAVTSHFSLSGEPALVAMPTGSGKSAVLMALAFALRPIRVLVVTPSVIVREQLAEGFGSLAILRGTGALSQDCPLPAVHEVTGYLETEADWAALEKFDVVVASPPSVSPREGKVARPPEGLFDLILVDEAHHEQAPTWQTLLECFPGARRVLCSATPFRNDRQALGARIVYHYPLEQAQKDGIFGQITFVPVQPGPNEDADVVIAQKAQALLNEDKKAGLDHRIMVRTSGKARAAALRKVYAEHTTLRLQEIHSGLTVKNIKKRIQALRDGELDGVICVDMMGEGFDFPNLKIAAIHAPHKSLPVTLQFIGRFARTGATGAPLGDARFIAEEHRIQHDEFRLFTSDPDDPDWREIIANLTDRRVQREVEKQEFLDTFEQTTTPPDRVKAARALSLGRLKPFHHVQVYQLPQESNFDLYGKPSLLPVIYAEVSADLKVAVLVWDEVKTPRWLKAPLLCDTRHHLAVVYFDEERRLLFLSSSQKETDIYEALLAGFAPDGAYEVHAPQLRRVMTGWKAPEIYSVGMRNRQAAIGQESYRILAGGAAHFAVSPRDGRRFTRGHAYGADVLETGKKTLGISSSYAKIWSLQYGELDTFIAWCRELAAKLGDSAADAQPAPLDLLDGGTVITVLPDPSVHMPMLADWPHDIYHHSNGELELTLQAPGQAPISLHPSELELRVRPEQSTVDALRFDIIHGDHAIACQLELTPQPRHSVLPGQSVTIERRHHNRPSTGLGLLLDSFAPSFWYDDLSHLTRNIAFKKLEFEPKVPDNVVKSLDWTAAGVDITAEVTCETPGLISIQNYLEEQLRGKHQIVFFDHDNGEAADYITLDLVEDEHNPVRIGLYHCKGTKPPRGGGPAAPGNRVEDLYEVLGQAVKCMRFRDRRLLLKHMLHREKKRPSKGRASRFVTGDQAELQRILTMPGHLVLPITVWVVQPGLDYERARKDPDPKTRTLFDNVLHFVLEQGSLFKVMCS